VGAVRLPPHPPTTPSQWPYAFSLFFASFQLQFIMFGLAGLGLAFSRSQDLWGELWTRVVVASKFESFAPPSNLPPPRPPPPTQWARPWCDHWASSAPSPPSPRNTTPPPAPLLSPLPLPPPPSSAPPPRPRIHQARNPLNCEGISKSNYFSLFPTNRIGRSRPSYMPTPRVREPRRRRCGAVGRAGVGRLVVSGMVGGGGWSGTYWG